MTATSEGEGRSTASDGLNARSTSTGGALGGGNSIAIRGCLGRISGHLAAKGEDATFNGTVYRYHIGCNIGHPSEYSAE